jgi:RNase P subunit RPR2
VKVSVVYAATNNQVVDNEYLTGHWQQPLNALHKDKPIAKQMLSADGCRDCHQAINNDWQASLHAKAMGPGILGQLKNYLAGQINLSEENSVHKQKHKQKHKQQLSQQIKQPKCLICHAPLTEQAITIDLLTNKNNTLAKEGINCASCHIRSGDVFSLEKLSLKKLSSVNQHNSQQTLQAQHQNLSLSSEISASDKFNQALFCASCHQFPASGRKLNGKLLQNTYIEWKNSPFAEQGIVCQDCHMPAGRHLWRGIHDKDMVLRGVTIAVDMAVNEKVRSTTEPASVKASLTLTNTGVGHYFPTYVTPRVIVERFQQNSQGEIIKGSYQSDEIMRAVSLDLVDEYFDARLAPNESLTLNYQRAKSALAKSIVFSVRVEPDYFYRNFYQASLDNDPSSIGSADLRKALKNSEKSSYILFEKTIHL